MLAAHVSAAPPSGAIVNARGVEPRGTSRDVPDGPSMAGVSSEKKASLPGARGASEPVQHRYRSVFHQHGEGQLIWFTGSVQQLRTPEAIWVTPAGGAVWIPPRHPHASVIHGDGIEHYVHVDAALCHELPQYPGLVQVTPELGTAAAPILAAAGRVIAGSCVQALCAEIRSVPVRALTTPLPHTLSRLTPIAEILEESPLDARKLEDWAQFSGSSASSLQRLVRRETGRSFLAWRLQFRLLWALEQLAAGRVLAEVSEALDYRRADTFSEVFRRELSTTPARYFQPLEQRGNGPASEVVRTTSARIQCTVRQAAAAQPRRGSESHAEGELVWGRSGVLSVGTPHGTWVLPAGYGIWIPPGQRHESRRWGETTMQRVRVEGHHAALPARCCAVRVTPALHSTFEAMRSARGDDLWDESSWDESAHVLLGEIRDAALAPLPLPLPPLEGLLVPLLAALREEPAAARSLEHWARYLGVSTRTLKRAFDSDTGLGFSRWRSLSRLRCALESLARGRDVAHAAQDAGYSSVSSFVALFRRVLGTTPGRYFCDSGRSRQRTRTMPAEA